ncbi:lysostaphin resistance A-like protein [Aestuariibius sp. 2305UL40-4]|uniref:CPBP family intramembrane glutamic endopeptidase n=1 Tax=Aestuariibius violaceus TaxID=3234132 RepID=UPI00345E906D
MTFRLHLLRSWAAQPRNGLLLMIALIGVYFAYFAIPALTQSNAFGRGEVETGIAPFLAKLPTEIGLAASVLAVVALLGWWQECRIVSRPVGVGFWALLLPALFVGSLISLSILALIGGAETDPPLTSAIWGRVLIFVVLVGIFEEVLFRGIVFHAIERVGGPVVALFLSSLLFGAMHYVNWMSGQPLGATTIQVLHAAGGGFLYGALMLRTGSIWPSVILHALWDLSVGLNSATFGQDQDPSLDAVAAAGDMAPTFLGRIGEVLLYGNEPIYGLIVLLFWLRWRRRQAARPS